MLKTIKKKVNDLNIRHKLTISFILVVFIPIIIVGGYLTNELRQLALADAEDQTFQNMERVKERVIEVLNVPIYVSNNILHDEDLKDIVNADYQTIYDVVAAYRDYYVFSNYLRIYDEITNIRFYMENPALLNNWQIIPPTNQIKNSIWYSTVKEGNGLTYWFYIEDETNRQQKFLSLVRKINFFDYQTSGVLVINVNTKQLNSVLSQESRPTMIVDEQNQIITSNQHDHHGKKLTEIVDYESPVNGSTGTIQGSIEGESTRIYIDEIPMEDSLNQLKVVSFISEESIAESAKTFSKIGFTVILISVSISLLFIYYLSKFLSNRILTLNEQVREVGKGNFNTKITIDGADEVGQVATQLQLMVDNTNQLLHKVHQSNERATLLERKQNQIKFKMMASQINPHFLFNALESIRMKAHLNGEKEISRIVKLLGKLMRNSIEVGTGKVKLIDEVEVVRYYLEIQKFRYVDRLSYELNIDSTTYNVFIPPLIIQPLVENAVIHALENSEDHVEVAVKANKVSEGLLIEVLDTGFGISKEKRIEINQSLNGSDEKEGDRIGLKNVHQRLQLLYGEKSGLRIKSELGTGTKVSFLIPTRRDKDV